METPERNAVRRGLDELKPHLAAYARRTIAESTSAGRLRSEPLSSAEYGSSDLSGTIRLILANWEAVFRSRLRPMVRTYLHEVRGIRNRWAHEEPFSIEEVRRALDTVRQVALAIGAPATIGERPADKATKRPVQQKDMASRPSPRSGDDLHARFVDTVNAGRPVLATYSWVYGRLFGDVPRPWSQGHGEKVITVARETLPRHVKNLGVTLLDTFVVSLKSGKPSPGHWDRRTPPYTREAWEKTFSGAVVLHGDSRAPWE